MPDTAQIKLPGSDNRTAVIGRTGSGKTVLAMWVLSTQDIDARPWVILDYKGDKLINKIDRAKQIDYSIVPTDPGVYILRVMPGDEELLSDWFRRVWETEGIGIYVDEGFMVGQRDRYFNACLTQGRSKEIPMIVLTQRPLWLSRFVFSEASYFFIFDITDADDMRAVKRFVAQEQRDKLDQRLPKYHSRYYSVEDATMHTFGPVPSESKILADIDAKIPKKRRMF